MNTTPDAVRARLRSADPASSLPAPNPQDVAARAMLDQIFAERPIVAPHRRPRQRRLAMAGVVAATAAAAVSVGVVVTPWSHGRPAASAYAVTEPGDGAVSVTVHWNELRDPAALNAELASLGARTVVMRQSADGECRTGFATDPAHSFVRIAIEDHPELRDPAKLREYMYAQMPWLEHETDLQDGAVFTIHPDKIPAGDTLLVPYQFEPSQPADRPDLGFQFLLVPEVPACVPSTADSIRTISGIQVR
jgi:hypothetical protein